MDLVDSHAHLKTYADRSDLTAVLLRAREAGVGQIVTIGTSCEDWAFYRDLAKSHEGRIAYTVGLHPSDVGDDWHDQVTQLAPFFADDPAPVGLGEIGLDFFRLPKYPDEAAEVKAHQEAAFRAQLELAAQFGGPIVVHSRAAFRDCVRVIDESPADWEQVVFHCWVDGPDEIRLLKERGGRASFTGIVTYKKAEEAREALKVQGVERLMLETDSPYLSPEPHRGKENEPARIADIARFCAAQLGIEPDELAARTTENARSFFGLARVSR